MLSASIFGDKSLSTASVLAVSDGLVNFRALIFQSRSRFAASTGDLLAVLGTPRALVFSVHDIRPIGRFQVLVREFGRCQVSERRVRTALIVVPDAKPQ